MNSYNTHFRGICIRGLIFTLIFVNLLALPVHAAPAAPTLNSALAGNSQVTLNWTKVSGAKNYSVKYGTSSGVYTTTINLGNVSTYTVTGLTNGTTYYFVVTATNNTGTSPNSNERSATPQVPPPVPLAPTLLSVTPGNTQVTLSWSASAGATAYTVKYGTRSGQHRTNVNAGNTTSFTVTGLMNNKIYYFVVTASNTSGESPKSNELSATPVLISPPSVPTLNNAAAGDGQVDLNWSSVSGATGYNVKYGTSSGNYPTAIDNGNTTSRTVTGLNNGTTYYFVITAYNTAGESGNSNEANATPQAPNEAPSVNAGGDTTINITQSANLDGTVSDDGLPNPPGAVTTTWTMTSGPGTVTFGDENTIDTTASFSVAGTFVLRLDADDSALSNFDELTVTVDPLATPNLTNATPGNTEVSLTWSSVTQASGYNVKYGTVSGTYSNAIDVANVTNYTVTGLTNGTTYYFVVSAYSGSIESADSNELAATPVVAYTDVSGAINANMTWTLANSPYRVIGNITVNSGVTLTVEPGVMVVFAGNYFIHGNGVINAQGTAGNMIVFTSGQASPAPGNWQYVALQNTGSIFNYVKVEYSDRGIYMPSDAGTPTIQNGLIQFNNHGIYFEPNTGPIILNNTIVNNAKGIFAGCNSFTGCHPTINNNSIHSNTEYNLFSTSFGTNASGTTINAENNWWGSADPDIVVNSHFDFLDNGSLAKIDFQPFLDGPNGIPVPVTVVYGPVTANATWSSANDPYVVVANTTVSAGVTLTIEPGVVVKFGTNDTLTVNGVLNAQGTSGNVITFTSNQVAPAPGAWVSVILNSTQSTALQYCKFEYAQRGLSLVNSSTPLEHNVFENNQKGIYIHKNSSPSIQNNSITNNTQYGIEVVAEDSTLPHPTINSNSITNNGIYNLFTNFTGIHVNHSGSTIGAELNWWGTGDPAQIAAKIWDYNDHNFRPHVDFVPYLQGPPDENLTIANNSVSPAFLNIRTAASTNINYSLNMDANVTIEIFNYTTNALVRILIDDQPRLAGAHAEAWDLRNDSGQSLPSGVYVYRVIAAAGTGSGAIYGPIEWPANDPVMSNGSVTPSASFSPSRGERMAISFQLDAPAFVSVGFEENEFISDAVLNSGSNTLYWDGWGSAGLLSFYQNTLSVDAVAQKVPATAIMLDDGGTIDVVSAQTNPYIIRPLYNDITAISYAINEAAVVAVSVLSADGATVLKVLENNVAKAPGSYELTWDGRDTGGNAIVTEGFYRVRIQAQDSFGSIVKRDVSIRIVY